MTIGTIRRLAADIMDVGENRVRISPDGFKEAEKAMTRTDVRDLIKKGIVSKVAVKGRRKVRPRKRKGRGSRKGAWKVRSGGKEVWMAKVRAQRAFLAQLVSENAFDKTKKRMLYMRIKSGMFRSKRAFLAYLKEASLVKQDYEPKKTGPAKRETPAPRPEQKAKSAKPETAKPVAGKPETKAKEARA